MHGLDKWNKNGFESVANIGIVLPKLFGNVAVQSDLFKKSLLMLLEDPFFTAIELSYIPDEALVDFAAKYAKKGCVEVIFNGGDAFRTLQIDLSSLDEVIRKKSVETCKMLIQQCYKLEAKIFHIVTGKYVDEKTRQDMLDAFSASVKELCVYAKEKKTHYELIISVETGDRHFDRKYLLGPTAEAVALITEVRKEHDNFGLLLDQSHLPIMQEDPKTALYMGREYLTHVHLGNCYIKDINKAYFGDKHLPFGVEDSEVGVEELTSFLRILKEIGFYKSPKPTKKPTLSFEVGPLEDESPAFLIANVKRVFYEAWQKHCTE